jgi:hypothetical protein
MQHRHPATPTEGGFPMNQFAMDQFVESQNIAHYTQRLLMEIDPIKRKLLQKLLVEEMVKQASHDNVGK